MHPRLWIIFGLNFEISLEGVEDDVPPRRPSVVPGVFITGSGAGILNASFERS